MTSLEPATTFINGWKIVDFRGSAARFHAMDLEHVRGIWVCHVDSAALVLGSTQSFDAVDAREATARGIELVRRRSGGGAVYVHPTDSIWIDVTIARQDPMWIDDVSLASMWLGRAFAKVFREATVHEGEFRVDAVGRSVCFASLAPGEVISGSAKVVGISQRRSRHGARFQCVVYRKWTPEDWTPVLVDSNVSSAANALEVATVSMTARDVALALASQLPN